MPRVAVRRRSAAERSCSIPSVKLCKHGECGAIAVSYDGYCACCTSRKRLKNYNSRPAATRMKDPIGMELEVVHPLGVDKITPIARYVCNDASIGHNGGEIKFVAPASKIADKAADIAQRAAHA